MQLSVERDVNQNNMVSKETHMTVTKDENGWILINLSDSVADGYSEDPEIREILSDYVVITVGNLAPPECGKREDVVKKKVKRFAKVPTRRLSMPYPLLAVPRYNHKIGKIRTHCLSTKRSQPYSRTRLGRPQGTLKSTVSAQPISCCPASLDTMHNPQSGFNQSSIKQKGYMISDFCCGQLQPKQLVEKRFPDYRMTLDDLYFVSTCCKINSLFTKGANAQGRGQRALLQRKLFVTGKDRLSLPAALIKSRDCCKSYALHAEDLSFRRLDTRTAGCVDIFEEMANTSSVRREADASYRLKASLKATNIYVDVLKELASKQSYSTNLGLKELSVSVGENLYQDLIAALKSVKEGTKPTRMDVCEELMKVVKNIEKDLNKEHRYYKDVLKVLGFIEKESSIFCVRASPGTTNIYEHVKKALNTTESDYVTPEVTFSPRLVKVYESSTSMPSLPDGKLASFSSVDAERQKAVAFSPLLLLPTPLCIEWKAKDQKTEANCLPSAAHILKKARALCEVKIVDAISRFPQLLPTVPQISGPTILLLLLGCHMMSVLRSYPALWPPTTPTIFRSVRSSMSIMFSQAAELN